MRYLLPLTVVLASTVSAQTGTYQTFGSGCPGTGVNLCASLNPNGGRLRTAISIQVVQNALQVTPSTPMLVSAFEIYAKSLSSGGANVSTQLYDHDANTNAPRTTPVSTSTMSLASPVAWYRTVFSPPVLMKPNQPFYLSWLETKSARILWPWLSSGQKGPYFKRNGGQGPWSGSSTGPWAFRVYCAGSATPVLSNNGVPTIGKSFDVKLSQAKAATGAALLLGASNTSWGPFKLPLVLTPFGAAGCQLLASPDFLFPAGTTVQGEATLTLLVPNLPVLVGGSFHNQWIVVDPSVNTMGLVSSNGGTGKVGR